jgi:hypothetical protein
MMAYQALEGILKLEKVTSRKVKYLCPSIYFMLNQELVFFPVLWIRSGSALIWQLFFSPFFAALSRNCKVLALNSSF